MTPTKDGIQSIYSQIGDLMGAKEDLQGWHTQEPIFERLIQEIHPRVIIEVGSWKGASAVRMAQLAEDAGLDTVIYCVDFWQDRCLHTGDNQIPHPWWGEISAYRQFLYNVWVNKCDDQIIPIRAYSPEGAKLLTKWGVMADLIYIDAGHDYASCLSDMQNYWPLLRQGGVMFGDDYTEEPGVALAVKTFTMGQPFKNTYYHWELDPK